MQQVSAGYAPYTDVRRTEIRVVFGLVDVTAATDAAPDASESLPFASQIEQTTNGADGMGDKYGTLEKDFFQLDGSFSLFPDNPMNHQMGWWSEQLSEDDGTFSNPPTLTFDFSEKHSSMGFTVVFDDKSGQYCTDFAIDTYGIDGKLLTHADVIDNDVADCAVELGTEEYTKVVFTFRRTNVPLRYVRVAQVRFGILQKQDNANTESAELLFEIDPSMASAPANEFNITISNLNRRYNMVNPSGVYKYLQQGQRLDVEFAVGDETNSLEYVNMGRYYFTSSQAKDSGLTAQITAHTPFYAMDKTTYRRGRQETVRVDAFISEVFTDAGFPIEVIAVGDVGSRLVSAACETVSHREAVRMAAQAARCLCVINRNDEAVLVDLDMGDSVDVLGMDNQEDVPTIERPERINTIELTTTKYSDGLNDPTVICECDTQIHGTETRWFDYSGPSLNPQANVGGGTIEEAQYYMCSARLKISADGPVSISISGTVMERTEAVYTAQLLDGGEGEQCERINNPLVADGHGQMVAEWLLKKVHNVYTYNVLDRGNPAREAGDTVTIYDAYGEDRPALVTKVGLKFDGTLSGTMEACGGIDNG